MPVWADARYQRSWEQRCDRRQARDFPNALALAEHNRDMTVQKEDNMRLGEMQERFSEMVPLLFTFAFMSGFKIRMGDVLAKDGHKKGSFHYKKLAIDVNLFKDGKYLTKTEDHRSLGEFWKSIGGTWGGDFKHKDGNHYSYGE